MSLTITKRLEKSSDINIEISEVDEVFFPANGLRVTLTKWKT